MNKPWNTLNWRHIAEIEWDLLYLMLKYDKTKNPDREYQMVWRKHCNDCWSDLEVLTKKEIIPLESLESMVAFIYEALDTIEADIRYLDPLEKHDVQYDGFGLRVSFLASGSRDDPEDLYLVTMIDIHSNMLETETRQKIPITIDKEFEYEDYKTEEDYISVAGAEAWTGERE